MAEEMKPTKISEVRDKFSNEEDIVTEDIEFLLDFADMAVAYMTTEYVPTEICQICPHGAEITKFNECEYPLDACADACERLFEEYMDRTRSGAIYDEFQGKIGQNGEEMWFPEHI